MCFPSPHSVQHVLPDSSSPLRHQTHTSDVYFFPLHHRPPSLSVSHSYFLICHFCHFCFLSLSLSLVIHFCKSRGSNTIQTELCQTPPIQQQTVREQRAKRLAVNRPGSWLKCRLRDQGGALAGVRSSLSTSSGATYVCQEDPLTVRHSHKQKKQGAPKKEQEVCSADSPIAGGDAEKWGKKEKKRNATFNLQWVWLVIRKDSKQESDYTFSKMTSRPLSFSAERHAGRAHLRHRESLTATIPHR